MYMKPKEKIQLNNPAYDGLVLKNDELDLLAEVFCEKRDYVLSKEEYKTYLLKPGLKYLISKSSSKKLTLTILLKSI